MKKVSLLKRCPKFRTILREGVPLYIHLSLLTYPRAVIHSVQSSIEHYQLRQLGTTPLFREVRGQLYGILDLEADGSVSMDNQATSFQVAGPLERFWRKL